MLDYRCFNCSSVPANTNIIELIKNSLEENEKFHLPNFNVKFVAFEAAANTTFKLNDQKEDFYVPSTGKFFTPIINNQHMKVYSLKFASAFTGKIYYIM